jgi:hypothetical protein
MSAKDGIAATQIAASAIGLILLIVSCSSC